MKEQCSALDQKALAALARLGRWALLCGLASIVISVLDLEVSLLEGDLDSSAVILFIINVLFSSIVVKAALALRRASRSEALSEPLLMAGFVHLRRYFKWSGVMLYPAVGVMALWLLLLLWRVILG